MAGRQRRQAQIGLDETPIDSNELADLLDDREEAKVQLKPYRVAYRDLNNQVKGKIEQMELADGSYRCGAFTIEIKPVESREISFERTSRKSIVIKPDKE